MPLVTAIAIGLRINGIPLEAWVTLPIVILAVYFLFRWRKFGEDTFTWNHRYLALAIPYGAAIWTIGYGATFLPELWMRLSLWAALIVIGSLALDYFETEGFTRSAILVLFLALIGLTAMPLPALVRPLVFGESTPRRSPAEPPIIKELRDAGKVRTLVVSVPENWRELPDQRPRAYRSDRPGAGILRISLFPPEDNPIHGPAASDHLAKLIDKLGPSLDPGKNLRRNHTNTPIGTLATARYQSDEHGLTAFFLIPSELTIFATYTDGAPEIAKQEITEAIAILKELQFESPESD